MVEARKALTAAAMAVAVACARAPQQTYPGPPLPLAEVAVLKDGSEAAVLEIDGVQVSGSSWTLMPGPHEVLVRFRIFTEVPNVNWTIWSYCRIELPADAGEEYVTRVRLRKEIAPGLSEKVAIELGIADGEGVLRGALGSCLPKRPAIKR